MGKAGKDSLLQRELGHKCRNVRAPDVLIHITGHYQPFPRCQPGQDFVPKVFQKRLTGTAKIVMGPEISLMLRIHTPELRARGDAGPVD